MPPIPPMPPMSMPPMSIPGKPPKPPNPKPYVSFLITGPIAAWSLTISFCKWFWNFTYLSKNFTLCALKIVFINLGMFLEYLISNVNADQCWHQWLLLLGPAWASVNEFLNHFITVGFHVLDLQVDGLLDITQSKFFIGLGAHSLGHHLLLDEWCELVLVFGEMLFWDTDFGHDLLLEGHANLLDLIHALGDHSEVLIEVLISF